MRVTHVKHEALSRGTAATTAAARDKDAAAAAAAVRMNPVLVLAGDIKRTHVEAVS